MQSKLKGFPKCYVINLEESAERREYMLGEFAKFGIHDVTIRQFKRLSDPQNKTIIKHDGTFTNKFPFGTTSSHLLAIKWWYENTDEEMAAFFEDDVDFSTTEHWNFNWEDYVKKLGHVWDGVQLCVMHEGWPVMYPRIRNGHDHGMQCYVIKRHYAKKLIDYYFVNDNTIYFKAPYELKNTENKKYGATVENIVYGLGIFYNHALFNHNVYKFRSVVHDVPDQRSLAEHSYHYVKNWWEKTGRKGSLDDLFTYEWCCPPGQNYFNVHHIY